MARSGQGKVAPPIGSAEEVKMANARSSKHHHWSIPTTAWSSTDDKIPEPGFRLFACSCKEIVFTVTEFWASFFFFFLFGLDRFRTTECIYRRYASALGVIRFGTWCIIMEFQELDLAVMGRTRGRGEGKSGFDSKSSGHSAGASKSTWLLQHFLWAATVTNNQHPYIASAYSNYFYS